MFRGEIGQDWGVCVNSESLRAGLVTFEHQGCAQFRSGIFDAKNLTPHPRANRQLRAHVGSTHLGRAHYPSTFDPDVNLSVTSFTCGFIVQFNHGECGQIILTGNNIYRHRAPDTLAILEPNLESYLVGSILGVNLRESARSRSDSSCFGNGRLNILSCDCATIGTLDDNIVRNVCISGGILQTMAWSRGSRLDRERRYRLATRWAMLALARNIGDLG